MLVLQHCRGKAEIDGDFEEKESEDENVYDTDGEIKEMSHRMVCHTSHILMDFFYNAKRFFI